MTLRLTVRFPRAALCAALGLAAVLGCGKSSSETAPPPPTGMPPGPGMPGGGPPPEEVLAKLPGGDEFAAGKKAYATNGCANCHKLGDTGGGGPEKRGPGGPNLTTAGANPEHTSKWLADHVRDPKSHKPQSRMPAYGTDKIGDADLTALADYLAGRK